MGPVDSPNQSGTPVRPADQPVDRTPGLSAVWISWQFSGVMLGAATWLLLLGVFFAALGSWIIAGALFGGVGLCLLAIWRAMRRLPAARKSGQGRHRSQTSRGEAA